jgi:hypothetical protein
MKNQGMEYQMFMQEDNSEISQKIQNIKKEDLKLFEFLKGLTLEHKLAWDCGTGNGQSAVKLANYYEKVYDFCWCINIVRYNVRTKTRE